MWHQVVEAARLHEGSLVGWLHGRQVGGGRERERKEMRRETGTNIARSKTGRQRTRNCATRGRFPPTSVILNLGVT